MINKEIINFSDTKINKITYTKISKRKNSKNTKLDYSKVIVRKPWGYEYLIYQSESVAVWILYLKKNHQTSMHCHPLKKTSLIVLDGKVSCENLEQKHSRNTRKGVFIDKKVFHRTKNNGDKNAVIMEIETPNYKEDLLRLKDSYGRKNRGYEKEESFTVNTNNYNYISLDTAKAYHNLTKKIGNSLITFVKIKKLLDLKALIRKDTNSLFVLLEGSIIFKNNRLNVCDTISAKTLNAEFKDISSVKNLLILSVKRNENSIKSSDLILNTLENQNINKAFVVAGDRNLHLLDSLGKKETFNYSVFNNEYFAAFAALGYSKFYLKPPVIFISGGSSTLKIIEAVCSAYIDSEPLIVISGQERKGENFNSKLRQLGNKSVNIIKLINSITKFSKTINKVNELSYYLEKAIFVSKNERPGPVWLDIPIDLLGKTVNESKLKHFDPYNFSTKINYNHLNLNIKKIYKLINLSKRPVILLGYGVRISNAYKLAQELINKLKIPVVTSRRGADLLHSTHKYYYGRPGVYGNRYSNYIIQNSDLLISIGSRLSIPLIGRNYKKFAKNAKKIVIDVDKNELNKKTLKIDLNLDYSADIFLDSMIKNYVEVNDFDDWNIKCKKIKSILDFKKEGYEHTNKINPYIFMKDLSNITIENSIIFMDGNVIMNYVMQSFKIKKNQRMITASGLDNIGFSLPASLGLDNVSNYKNLVVLCEESVLLNTLDQIKSITKSKLAIKIIVFSDIKNIALKNSQRDFFGSRFVATETNNLSSHFIKKFPYEDLNLKFEILQNPRKYKNQLNKFMKDRHNHVILVELDKNHKIIPKMGFDINYSGNWSPKSLEDMYPFFDVKKINEILD